MNCTLYYSQMEKAASCLDKAVGECRDYSDSLTKKVANKLDDLRKGSSTYTSNASYFVSVKKRDLEQKASDYTRLASAIRAAKKKASDTDARVASYIKTEGNSFRKRNGLDYGIFDGFAEAIARFAAGFMNSTTFGRWLTDKIRKVHDGLEFLKTDFKHWFYCDGGKYWIKLGLAVISVVVTAIALIVAVWPILFVILGLGTTAIGVWTWITLISTAVMAIITFADSLVSVYENYKALRAFNSDPGWAARYGSITTASDYFRKTVFKSRIGNLVSVVTANFIDITSFVCSAISVANLFRNGYRFFTDANRVNSNWRNKFRIWDSNGKFSLKKTLKNFKFNFKALEKGLTTNAQVNQRLGALKRTSKFYNKFSSFTNATTYKNFTNTVKKIKSLVSKYESNKSVNSQITDKIKSKTHYKDIEDVINNGKKIRTDYTNPLGSSVST